MYYELFITLRSYIKFYIKCINNYILFTFSHKIRELKTKVFIYLPLMRLRQVRKIKKLKNDVILMNVNMVYDLYQRVVKDRLLHCVRFPFTSESFYFSIKLITINLSIGIKNQRNKKKLLDYTQIFD